MYLGANFWLGCSRKWVEKVQTIISFQPFYIVLILPFEIENNVAEDSWNFTFFHDK